MKKVYYISPSAIPSRSANSVHVANMCEAFSQHNCDVKLFVRTTTSSQLECKQVLSNFYGIDNKFINVEPYFSSTSRGSELIIALRAFYVFILDALKGVAPDYIISRNLYAAFLIGLLLRKSLIYETHAPEIGLRKYLQKLVIKSNMVRTIVISEALKKIIIHAYSIDNSENIHVLHDAARSGSKNLNASERSALKKQRFGELAEYDKVVGYFGHLYQGRGIEIIQALSIIHSDLLFVIYGGNETEVQFYKSNSANKNIIFMGHIPPEKVGLSMSMVDILLMPYQKKVSVGLDKVDTSKWMSPMKMFEYMSTGNPIISSDLSVLKEVLINEKNALLVSPDNVNDWSDALQKLTKSDSLRKILGENAFKDYQDYYTWTARAKNMLTILR